MLTSLVYLQQGNVKKYKKLMKILLNLQQGNVKKYKNLMKIVVIDKQNLHIFRMT